jgi:4-aminobutyrate aminotransferase-like enzyme
LTIYQSLHKERIVAASAQLSQILKQATGVVAARGEGALLYDEDDRRYLADG